MNEILFKEESYTIVGKCMKVRNNLGAGFLEIFYKDALKYKFKMASIQNYFIRIIRAFVT
jgi:GxxExxY protein